MARSFVTALISTVGGRLLRLLSSMLLTPVIIAFAGTQTYGEFGTLLSAFAMATILMSEGVHSGVRKYISEERERQNWQNEVFGFYFRIAVVMAVLTALAFVLAARFGLVTFLWGEKYVPYFYLLAPLAVATQFKGYFQRTLMGLKLEHIAEPVRVFYKVSFIGIAIVATYLGYGIVGLIASQIVASLLSVAVSLWFVIPRVAVRSAFSIPSRDFPRRELFTFNYNSIAYTFLLMSLFHVDILMLESFTGSEQVGYYKAAMVITQFLWFVPRSMQSVMVQSTSNMWAQGRTEEITEMASRITRYVLALTLLLALGMASLAPDFVRFYLGNTMLPSVTPLLILLPGTLGFAIARPILSISQAKGQLRTLIVTTAAAAAINFGLNVLLIPRYGILGAAIATTTGYTALGVLQFFGARYLGYNPFADLRLGRIAATAAVSAVPIFLVARLLDNHLLSLAVVPVVGFVTYSALTFATGVVRVDEVFDILTSAPGPIGAKAATARERIRSVDLSAGIGAGIDAEVGAADPLSPADWNDSTDSSLASAATPQRIGAALVAGLVLLGLLFLVSGLLTPVIPAVADVGDILGGGASPAGGGNATTTAAPTHTATPDDQTATPDDGATTTATSTATAAPASDSGDGDTPTATPADTPTTTATPTDASTTTTAATTTTTTTTTSTTTTTTAATTTSTTTASETAASETAAA